jgi:desulfoferrodoxin (superoxide reductase-like protein)
LINGFMPNLNGLLENGTDPIPALCQLWYDSQVEPVVVNVSNIKYAWHEYWGVDKTGGYEPHFLSCELPSSHEHAVPSSVTLVENACDKGTNHMKVMNERPTDKRPKTDFGVCVRNAVFPFEDKSKRYIEWIELQLAMGASQIYFYVMDVHPNIEKVFKYYEALGKIRVSYMSYPTGSPNIHGLPLEYQRQNGKTVKWETISLNDCYYRNMYKHKFLAMLDPDELLMPKQHFGSWYELFDAIEHSYNISREDFNSFNFQHSYFLDYPDQEAVQDIPSFLYMFQHVNRVAKYSKMGMYIKSFHNTANCYAMHNHFPMLCVQKDDNWCNNFWVNRTHAQLNHYRKF